MANRTALGNDLEQRKGAGTSGVMVIRTGVFHWGMTWSKEKVQESVV